MIGINISIDPIVQKQTRQHYDTWRRERMLKQLSPYVTHRTCNTCRRKVEVISEKVYRYSYYGKSRHYTTFMCEQCHANYKGRFFFTPFFEERFDWFEDD